MRGAFTLSAFIAAATAATDAITIRSTTISSSCSSTSSDLPVLPSSALSGGYYGNSSIPQSIVPATTSKTKKVSYQYETAYATDAVDITRTVCDSNGQCYVTTDIGKLTTYTTTINGILTVITTGVPVEPTEASATEQSTETSSFYQSNAGQGATETHSIAEETTTTKPAAQSISKETTSSEESIVAVTSSGEPNQATNSATSPTTTAAPVGPHTEYLTTLVTVTSCSENKCSEVPKTTGVKIISELDTVYTTYCPLTEASESSVATSAPQSEESTEVPQSKPPQSETQPKESTEVPQESTEAPTTSAEVPAPSSEVANPETSASSTKSKSQATVNVITDNIVTETPSVEQQQATSQETVAAESASSTSESPGINTYEGAAMSMKATGFVTVAISILMMMI
ncbi:Pga38 protein [Candida orthopsilosis Co 90-125]|uniref:Pga38 protein n=1 Tax=Candida orthopsilosis (strain 90-125) TaxID=1136231 RepID=H8X6Y8_CANO9|nr:Pga38 protein [Candida orthopsilosis Co 90-125]CCG23916.1 Pga38 protein [Candida orthopsilosis Co 90-125]